MYMQYGLKTRIIPITFQHSPRINSVLFSTLTPAFLQIDALLTVDVFDAAKLGIEATEPQFECTFGGGYHSSWGDQIGTDYCHKTDMFLGHQAKILSWCKKHIVKPIF